jgi:hypothetical protein
MDELEKLRRENAELNSIFDLQWKRMQEAIKLWQKHNPGHDYTWPDLGRLLEWLMDHFCSDEDKEDAWKYRDLNDEP